MTFRYVEADGVAEAVELIGGADGEAHLIAGGTALVPLLRTGYVQPSLLVGMRRLANLRRIDADAERLVLGSLATHTDVASSPVVRGRWPLLAEACGRVGTVRIRNQGTIGGNVVHADPNEDPLPALLALDATALVAGPTGERTIAFDDLFVDVFETAIDFAEILLEIHVPAAPPGTVMTYRKFLPRSQDDYATVAVAALLRRADDGRIVGSRVGLAGVAPRPIRARAVESVLDGERPSPELIADAGAALDPLIDPIADARGSVRYKRAMARVWLERTLAELCDVALQ
jgi:aerobic carbon-monoxide dehydrogenase medium subunit